MPSCVEQYEHECGEYPAMGNKVANGVGHLHDHLSHCAEVVLGSTSANTQSYYVPVVEIPQPEVIHRP